MKMTLGFLTVATLSLFASGCSTSQAEMNTGDRISQRAGDIGAYGEAWSDGQRDVRQGEQMVQKNDGRLIDAEKDLARARERVVRAESRIAEARANQAEGQQLIQGGTVKMQQAEDDYSAIRAGPPAITPQN